MEQHLDYQGCPRKSVPVRGEGSPRHMVHLVLPACPGEHKRQWEGDELEAHPQELRGKGAAEKGPPNRKDWRQDGAQESFPIQVFL